MAISHICVVLLSLFLAIQCKPKARYQPNWSSLDARPLPQWYDEAKLGIFIHWGVFSVPSFGSEWFWENWKGVKGKSYVDFMKKNYKPDFTYADFAKDFTAEFFNPDQWMDMFAASGAKYIVFVSKHHEGYCNWQSNVSFSWNSMAVGPNMDIVKQLAEAAKSKPELHFGLYHSLFEWFHPLYLQDKANNYSTTRFVDEKTMPELYELVNTFKPEVIWSDGDWEAPDTYWKSTEFLAWLYNDSPVKDTVVTNDRWGKGVTCHHGGYYTCMDRYNPGKLQNHKWENAMTIDKKSWGFRREAVLSDYMTMEELLETFAETVSCGGNMLMNVGPTKYGIINPIFEERLRNMGDWLSVNGEAIYGTRPWVYQNDTVTPRVWYTKNGDNVYAIIFAWPTGDTLELGGPTPSAQTTVDLLGYSTSFTYQKRTGGGIVISIPPIPINQMPCKWAWVIRFQALSNIN